MAADLNTKNAAGETLKKVLMQMNNETVIVLDFGGQYKELIARRVRECGVYSVIKPGDASLSELLSLNPIGIITTGGPLSVYGKDSPKCSPELFRQGIPILGICYGFQLMTRLLGGEVKKSPVSEYGETETFLENSPLFEGLSSSQITLMSHTDIVTKLPKDFKPLGKTGDCPIAAAGNENMKLYGVQFHPEVEHTKNGLKIIRNFLYNVCGASGDYSMDDYIDRKVKEIREQAKNEKVILGLSGGVDSSVAAALISKAIGENLTCIFVDHGFMRKNEAFEVKEAFKNMKLNMVAVDASDRFLSKLKGISDPEKKRKIIGSEFVEVFREQAKKRDDAKFLAQGTIYPDVIESGNKKAATIKSHHNVGGLPEDLGFEGLIEPLRGLFKDEVRVVGKKLGLPDYIINRQPFPGPGLAIRVIGDLTKEKLDLLRDADAIFRKELENSGEKASQYFAVLTNSRSVGVMGDDRTYDYTIALRAVITSDFMTCEYAPLSYELLSKVSSRITNEVKGVNRVVYDITGKPPATIEWE